MNVNEFWQLIEKTKIESKGDTDKQIQLLVDLLVEMPLEEILIYYQLYLQLQKRADRGSLHDAAAILRDGCSSDGFIDFRAWLIAQGKETFESAIQNPDTLADYVSLEKRYETSAERIGYVAAYAYRIKTNSNTDIHEDMPPYKAIDLKFEKDDSYYGCMYGDDDNPSTESFGDCIKRRYPNLCAKFRDS